MKKTVLMASLGLLLNLTPAYALIPNGDFETGDLTGYTVQENFADVPSSPFVQNEEVGGGNHAAVLRTGGNAGVTISTLGHYFPTLPADVQDLVFDVEFVTFHENPPILTLASSPQFDIFNAVPPDVLTVSLYTNSGSLSPFFAVDGTGFAFDANVTTVDDLGGGKYQVKTNLASLAGATNSQLYFDLLDQDDNQSSKATIDNIALTNGNQAVAPEPASMLLMGAGLAGFGYLRKKKMV
jgi:hypothetical protein